MLKIPPRSFAGSLLTFQLSNVKMSLYRSWLRVSVSLTTNGGLLPGESREHLIAWRDCSHDRITISVSEEKHRMDWRSHPHQPLCTGDQVSFSQTQITLFITSQISNNVICIALYPNHSEMCCLLSRGWLDLIELNIVLLLVLHSTIMKLNILSQTK